MKKRQDNNKEATNPGWNQREQWYLNRYDDAEAGPDIQILTDEDWEDKNKERREYFCAICKSRLDFLKESKTIWRCNECMQFNLIYMILSQNINSMIHSSRNETR